jgi:hypothetical protein
MMEIFDDDLSVLLRGAFGREPRGTQSPEFTRQVVRLARAADGPRLPRAALALLLFAFSVACAAALTVAPAALAELREGLMFWIGR